MKMAFRWTNNSNNNSSDYTLANLMVRKKKDKIKFLGKRRQEG